MSYLEYLFSDQTSEILRIDSTLKNFEKLSPSVGMTELKNTTRLPITVLRILKTKNKHERYKYCSLARYSLSPGIFSANSVPLRRLVMDEVNGT